MSKNGLVVDGEGWFVVNARESRWRSEGPLGSYCTFEGKRRFPQLGFNVSVLQPGEAIGMYHVVAAGEAAAVVVAVGARGRGVGGGVVYTVSDVAARHGVSVPRETTSSAEAYEQAHAGLPRSRFAPYRPGWLPEGE
jgi:GNAT superfamily N-acetyltransferase